MEESFLALLEDSIRKHWDLDALTDYKGATLQYKDLARKIEKMHILFEESGIQKGDKIAICGKNSSLWGVAFLSILSYGAVAVPILHEFKAENIHNIVNHSDAKLFFVGGQVWTSLSENEMPNLEGVILIEDFSLILSRSEKLSFAREHLNELFGKRYPKNFRPEHVSYHQDQPEEMCMINYTSGSTGRSKGVMIPYRAIWSNAMFAKAVIKVEPGDKVVSILPMAHAYGMAFEFNYEILQGAHIYFLTKIPSPKIIFQAFSEIKPVIVIAVPLIIEKIIKKNVLPKLETPTMKVLMHLPFVSDKVKNTVRQQIIDAFGGNFYEVIIGGAAFNQEVEQFMRNINFPYTVGYGMTECAPIIGYEDYKKFKLGSCGKAAPRMELKINSADSENIPGELLCRGMNVMLGYYKNEEATRQAIDEEGWLHTGDLATIDKDGNIFIKGRNKNMLLGPNGQNIYPEEIEDKLNNYPYVNESIVIQKEDKLIGLVYPDFELASTVGMKEEDVIRIMEENRITLNKELPAYSQISSMKIYHEEFEKTPKKSIKRFMYQ